MNIEAQRQVGALGSGAVNSGTILDRLGSRREILQAQIDALDAAIKELEDDPRLVKVIDAIQSVGLY